MSDLLNSLGKKSSVVEGAGKTSEPNQTSTNSSNSDSLASRGDDLLVRTGKKSADVSANVDQNLSTDGGPNQTNSSKVEPSGDSTWTAESALKEVKKLREENKAYRIKYETQIDQIKQETDARVKAKEAEMQQLAAAKLELDRIKAEQEDKKRDLSEKVAHREAKLAEMQAILNAKEKEAQERLASMEHKVRDYEARVEAENQVYKSRLNEELGKIPEKYRDYANLLIKGAGEPREALMALSEASLKGLFEDKTIVVNHSIPGAHDGARSTKDRLEEAERTRRSSMSPSQKIAESLKSIKSGSPNSVFRTK